MKRIPLKDRIQIGLLIGGTCLFAFVLQNFEGWHAKYVLSEIEPEIVSASITSINPLPSNTGSSYVVEIQLASGETGKLIGSLRNVRTCKIGQYILIERRGMDFSWHESRCDK